MPSDEGYRDINDMPDEIQVLFIEGFCGVPWYQNRFWTCPPMAGHRPFESTKNFRVWCTDESCLDSAEKEHIAPDAYGIETCITEIKSGKYHAIVVVDFSTTVSRQIELFERNLGELIQQFVEAGGVVAFPATEQAIMPYLRDRFGVAWRMSNYYRTTWQPCPENEQKINYSFGNGNLSRRVVKSYSAKSITLKSVPPHERCFGVGPDSTTESMVPFMSGKNVSRGNSKNDNEDYDVNIAMHDFGKGAIAFFGDVNAEEPTLWLVGAFVQSRSPKLPVDAFCALHNDEFEKAIQWKEEGNTAFGNIDLHLAEEKYRSALDIFGTRLGSNGTQRNTLIALLSNLSLVYIKLKMHHEAEATATKGLDVECNHAKCSYRRAMARLQISHNTRCGDLPRLQGAMQDLVNSDREDNATRKLYLKVEKEKKRLGDLERKTFSSKFAAAMSGTL